MSANTESSVSRSFLAELVETGYSLLMKPRAIEEFQPRNASVLFVCTQYRQGHDVYLDIVIFYNEIILIEVV